MKTRILSISLTLLLLGTLVPGAFGQTDGGDTDESAPALPEDRTKLGQTVMQFLTVPVDPRAAAMAEAMASQHASSVSMLYNPAGMAQMESSFHTSLGQAQWIADITYNQATVAYQPGDGQWGTVGLQLMNVSYGEFTETVRSGNDQGFERLGNFSPSSQVVGVGYARSFTDRFSAGANVKYVMQGLGSTATDINEAGDFVREDNDVNVLAYDFGAMYQTGFRSMNFALSIRNFAPEISYGDNSFELPLTFQVGVSMDMIDFTSLNQDMHSFVLALDGVHPRAFKEQVRLGGEYLFMNTLALRAGYAVPSREQEGINLGVGLQQEMGGIGLGADYAFSQWGTFQDVHRLALQVSF